MLKSLKNFKRNEKGDVMILYALLFTFLIGFLSFSVDLGLMYMKRMKMYEIGNVMRQTRFTKNGLTNETFLNSNNPGQRYAQVFNDYARKNGFKGKLTVRYVEDDPATYSYQKRNYKIDMWLEDEYKTTTLSVLNIKSLPIKVHIAGSGFSEVKGNYLWVPKNNYYRYYEETFNGN